MQNVSCRLKGDNGPEIEIEMDYFPAASSNRRLTRNRYTGATVLRHDVEKWMEQLAFIIHSSLYSGKMTFNLPLRVTVSGEFPTNVYCDLSNFHKAICDAIEDGTGQNDKYYLVKDEKPKVIPGCEPKLIIRLTEAYREEAGTAKA